MALTLISPLPPFAGLSGLLTVSIVIFVLCRLVARVSAPMPLSVWESVPATIAKSTGSINHVPLLPEGASVVIRVFPFTVTFAPEVSMKPPSPPLGALASSLPPTMVSPCPMSDMSNIFPFLFTSVWASITPLLFTTALVKLSAALAVITTMPPSALISPLFSASASTAPCSTLYFTRPSPTKSRATLLPAAMTTLPSLAVMLPSLITRGPRKAT